MVSFAGVYDIPESAIHELVNDKAFDQAVEGVDQAIVEQLKAENTYLKERVQELENARERADMIAMALTRQLEQNQRLLEFHQATWWRRWFTKKSDAGGG